MKTETKRKENIVRLAFRLIRENGLSKVSGKEAAKILLPAIKKQFPKSKAKQDDVSWYLSRFRWQHKTKRSVDHLVKRPIKGRK